MNNIELNRILFNAVVKKEIAIIRSVLKEKDFSFIKMNNKENLSNILHNAFWDFDIFMTLLKLDTLLINDIDIYGESPLFSVIRKNKFNQESLVPYINSFQLNIINKKGNSLLDYILISNSFSEKNIKKIIDSTVNLTEENFYRLYKKRIISKHFFPKEVEKLHNKMYPVDFNSEYLTSLKQLSAESFTPKNSKKFKKLFFELTNFTSKEEWPHTKLQLLVIFKNHFQNEVNPDLIYNFIINSKINNYGFIKNKDYFTYISILKKIKPFVSISVFFNLLEDLFFIENVNLDFIKNNIFLIKRAKKIKTWYDLEKQLVKEFDFIKMQSFNNIKLHQQINILNDKAIDDSFQIIVPQTQEELTKASYFLDICVGKTLHYTKKIKNFSSLIIFLEEINSKKIKYCLELSTSHFFKIIQAKGHNNIDCPIEIVDNTQKVIDTIMGRYL